MKENSLVSVLVVNYNKKRYIHRCLRSLELQTYKNFEVIFFDDKSLDGSICEVKKFFKKLNIRLIVNNKRKKNITAFDQLNSYSGAACYAKGKIITFLDSDDFFDKNKIKCIVSYFNLNKKNQIVFDLPKIFFSKEDIKVYKFTKRISLAPMWPRFPPQSCISIRANFFKKVFKSIFCNKFPNITLDFRIAVYSFFISKDFNIINNYLTYYFQDKFGESKKFSFLSKNWWIRRLEAHKYLKYFLQKNELNYFFGIDFIVTYIFCIFLKPKKAS
jgi:glycosyltransferase involved in cell wall biosynthesis